MKVIPIVIALASLFPLEQATAKVIENHKPHYIQNDSLPQLKESSVYNSFDNFINTFLNRKTYLSSNGGVSRKLSFEEVKYGKRWIFSFAGGYEASLDKGKNEYIFVIYNPKKPNEENINASIYLEPKIRFNNISLPPEDLSNSIKALSNSNIAIEREFAKLIEESALSFYLFE